MTGDRGSRESHDSNGSKRLSALVVILTVFLPVAAVGGGCGTSTAATGPDAAATAVPSSDASIPLIMVVTGGGGGSSSGAMVVDPFGGSSSGSSSSSGGEDASGSSSGAGEDASDGGSPSGSDDASDGGTSPEASPYCDGYVAPVCGTGPCDLRSNTCCVDQSAHFRCVAGAKATCTKQEATVHCLQACECGGTDVCCGVENVVLGSVQTACQSVASLADGGKCNPPRIAGAQDSAQLCKLTAECQNGEACVAQTCVLGAMLSICGLQSQPPFNCH